MTTTTSNPPTLRRCRRIMEAHHLDCQGLKPQQIADQLRCSRSTVYTYFSEFRLHRAHILRTVAADQLVDHVHLLTQPQSDPAEHRQHVATARELRLLLSALPQLEAHEQQLTEDAKSNVPDVSWDTELDPEGHLRFINGPNIGECDPWCRECTRLYWLPAMEDSDESAQIETEPDSTPQFPEESGQNWTDLDESGRSDDEYPVQDREFQPNPPSFPQNPQNLGQNLGQIAPLPKPVGPEYPVSWDNPLGYVPRTQLIAQTNYTPQGGLRSSHPTRWR